MINQSYNSFDDDIPTNLNSCNCKNGGVCVDSKCHCKPGHSGRRCETPICRPVCSNGGECIDVNVCNCKDGFTGARCQTGMRKEIILIIVEESILLLFPELLTFDIVNYKFIIAFCHPECLNGGSCIAPFKCACPLGVSGMHCQECKYYVIIHSTKCRSTIMRNKIFMSFVRKIFH